MKKILLVGLFIVSLALLLLVVNEVSNNNRLVEIERELKEIKEKYHQLAIKYRLSNDEYKLFDQLRVREDSLRREKYTLNNTYKFLKTTVNNDNSVRSMDPNLNPEGRHTPHGNGGLNRNMNDVINEGK